MSDENWDEKWNEKEREKQEEKVDEKQTEKYQSDRLSTIAWALILVWAGAVALAANARMFEDTSLPFAEFPWGDWLIDANAWGVFFVGVAAILLLEILARLLLPEYRRSVLGTFILVIIFVALGFGRFDTIWPLILIAVGLSIVFSAFTRKR